MCLAAAGANCSLVSGSARKTVNEGPGLRRQWERIRQRAVWSWAGWLECWRTEASLKEWAWANLASAALAVLLELTTAERALIISLGVLVLAAELLNTSIERAVDYISTDEHPLARQAKDTASAAVALAACAVGVAWVVVLVGLAFRT